MENSHIDKNILFMSVVTYFLKSNYAVEECYIFVVGYKKLNWKGIHY